MCYYMTVLCLGGFFGQFWVGGGFLCRLFLLLSFFLVLHRGRERKDQNPDKFNNILLVYPLWALWDRYQRDSNIWWVTVDTGDTCIVLRRFLGWICLFHGRQPAMDRIAEAVETWLDRIDRCSCQSAQSIRCTATHYSPSQTCYSWRPGCIFPTDYQNPQFGAPNPAGIVVSCRKSEPPWPNWEAITRRKMEDGLLRELCVEIAARTSGMIGFIGDHYWTPGAVFWNEPMFTTQNGFHRPVRVHCAHPLSYSVKCKRHGPGFNSRTKTIQTVTGPRASLGGIELQYFCHRIIRFLVPKLRSAWDLSQRLKGTVDRVFGATA